MRRAGERWRPIGLGGRRGPPETRRDRSNLGDFSLPPFTYFSVGADGQLHARLHVAGAGRSVRAAARARGVPAASSPSRATGGHRPDPGDGSPAHVASLRAQIATVESPARPRPGEPEAGASGFRCRLGGAPGHRQRANPARPPTRTLLPPLRQQLERRPGCAGQLLHGRSACARRRCPSSTSRRSNCRSSFRSACHPRSARRRPDILAAEAQWHASYRRGRRGGRQKRAAHQHHRIGGAAGRRSSAHLFDHSGSVFGLAWGASSRRCSMAGHCAPSIVPRSTQCSRAPPTTSRRCSWAFGQVADLLLYAELRCRRTAVRMRAQDPPRARDVELTPPQLPGRQRRRAAGAQCRAPLSAGEAG